MNVPDPARLLRPASRKFVRLMRLAALLSVGAATLAVVLAASGDSDVRVHRLIATALGVGLSVLLGIALMTLVFFKSRVGQENRAADYQQKDDNDPRP